MSDSYSTGKAGLISPIRGSYSGTWDGPVNSDWSNIDSCLSATYSITLSNANVTLVNSQTTPPVPSLPQTAYNRYLLQGVISTNITIYIPGVSGAANPCVGGTWCFDNQTSGSFSVTIKTTVVGSTGVTVPQGGRSTVISDGTNIYHDSDAYIAQQMALAVRPGALMSYAMSSPPSGWLVCDGSAVSRTTYASLFSAIGTTWGAGDTLTTFNVPNFQGAFLRGWNPNATGNDPNRVFASYQADSAGPHGHPITDPGHTHVGHASALGTYGGGAGNCLTLSYSGTSGVNSSDSVYMNSNTTGITVNNNTGTTETAPKNYAVLICIKT